jgi:hypothetical protein
MLQSKHERPAHKFLRSKEINIYKNRFILVLGLLSILFVGMAVTQSRSLVSSATGQAASDFYQRHPEYTFGERFGTRTQSVPQQTLKSH